MAATAISWIAYLGTADGEGRPHVAAVAPGFSEQTLWVATRRQSKKVKNLAINPNVGFHWPVAGGGPGELAAWGEAAIHDSAEDRVRIWNSGVMPYDLAGFFQEPGNPSLVFVEIAVIKARLFGPEGRKYWVRRSSV